MSTLPAWTMDDEAMLAEAALQVISSARDHGLDPADYGEQEIIKFRALQTSEDAPEKGSAERAKWLAEADVRITSALLALGRHVALGRTKPERIDRRWKARREAPDFVTTLDAAMMANLSTWLDTIRPQHPQYAALQKALQDPAMAEHAGVLALNLERWRWMPDDLGDRHIMVNIPSFHLVAREGGQIGAGDAGRRRQAGKQDADLQRHDDHDSIQSLLERPRQHRRGRDRPGGRARSRIPEAQQHGDPARHEVRRNGRRSFNGGLGRSRKSSKHWHSDRSREPKNALGHVKFLFPNPYDVYLHDTPADALFARQGRAFSHGCVRVEQPEALAKWVLRDSPEWTDEKILEAMHAGEEQHVKLKQKIPVHIVYFTAWADDAGTVRRGSRRLRLRRHTIFTLTAELRSAHSRVTLIEA